MRVCVCVCVCVFFLSRDKYVILNFRTFIMMPTPPTSFG